VAVTAEDGAEAILEAAGAAELTNFCFFGDRGVELGDTTPEPEAGVVAGAGAALVAGVAEDAEDREEAEGAAAGVEEVAGVEAVPCSNRAAKFFTPNPPTGTAPNGTFFEAGG
jgi:hypothetical protein